MITVDLPIINNEISIECKKCINFCPMSVIYDV